MEMLLEAPAPAGASLDELKAYLRVTGTSEDIFLDRLLGAVIGPDVEYDGDYSLLLARAMMGGNIHAVDRFRIDMHEREQAIRKLALSAGAQYYSLHDRECPGTGDRACRLLAAPGVPVPFVSAIVEGRQAAPSFYDGLKAQAVADAAIAHHTARADKVEAENARLRERVAALEERTEAAEGRVLALADALADVVLLIHEKGHSGMPSRCERGVCVTGWQLVAAVRESAVDSLAADFAAALAGQETAGGAS